MTATAIVPVESKHPGGPRTPEGKARCRLNALRHGLTGKVFLLTEEETEPFRQHSADLDAYYKPVGPLEKALACQIALGIWRLERCAAMEQGIFSTDAVSQPEPGAGPAQTWQAQAKSLSLLGTYEGRIRRALEKDKAELQQVQQARKEEAAQAMQLALKAQVQAKRDNVPYDPTRFFDKSPATVESVFSADLVARELDRRDAIASVANINLRAPRP